MELPAVGKVTFEWTALEGADSYLLTFNLPSGKSVTLETGATTRDRYMEVFSPGGEYQWNVTALAVEGNLVCSSASHTFTKPENAPQGDGDDGNDTCADWCQDDGNGN